jgi:hypothetical protein
MHISSTKAAISAPASPGKSAVVPPGLARRGLALPPGIAKKLDDGGATPTGVSYRFTPPTRPETPIGEASDGDVLTTVGGPAATAPVVDMLV